MSRRLATVVIGMLLAACGTSARPVRTSSPPAGFPRTSPAPATLPAISLPYHPVIDPSRFSATVDNPWFPLSPGTTFVYEGIKDGEPSRDVYVVTGDMKVIDGVPCVVVHDSLYLAGALEEETFDYYSQDRQGNVWYFGEDTKELDAKGNVALEPAVLDHKYYVRGVGEVAELSVKGPTERARLVSVTSG
jgi:hypothetical protein